MTADNLTVIKGGSATFANRVDSQDKTLEVSNTIEVQRVVLSQLRKRPQVRISLT